MVSSYLHNIFFVSFQFFFLFISSSIKLSWHWIFLLVFWFLSCPSAVEVQRELKGRCVVNFRLCVLSSCKQKIQKCTKEVKRFLRSCLKKKTNSNHKINKMLQTKPHRLPPHKAQNDKGTKFFINSNFHQSMETTCHHNFQKLWWMFGHINVGFL